jgi:hypothetical protein
MLVKLNYINLWSSSYNKSSADRQTGNFMCMYLPYQIHTHCFLMHRRCITQEPENFRVESNSLQRRERDVKPSARNYDSGSQKTAGAKRVCLAYVCGAIFYLVCVYRARCQAKCSQLWLWVPKDCRYEEIVSCVCGATYQCGCLQLWPSYHRTLRRCMCSLSLSLRRHHSSNYQI